MPYPQHTRRLGSTIGPNSLRGPWRDPDNDNKPQWRPGKPANDNSKARKTYSPSKAMQKQMMKRLWRRALPGAGNILDLIELYPHLFPGEGPYTPYAFEAAPPGWSLRRNGCPDCGPWTTVNLFWAQNGTPTNGTEAGCAACVTPGNGAYHGSFSSASQSPNTYVGWVTDAALLLQDTPYSWTRDAGTTGSASDPVPGRYPYEWRNPGNPWILPHTQPGVRPFYPEAPAWPVPGPATAPAPAPLPPVVPNLPVRPTQPANVETRPSRRPRPNRQRGRDVPAKIVVVGGGAGLPPRGTEGKHPREPREREAKPRSNLPRWAFALVSSLTEVGDFVDAIHDALPWMTRRWSGRRIQDKIATIFQNFDKVDWQEALKNLIANEINDNLIGAFGKLQKAEAEKLNRMRGLQVRPTDQYGNAGEPFDIGEYFGNIAVYGHPDGPAATEERRL